MKRRKFIQSTVAASALPLTYAVGNSTQRSSLDEKELYEIRTYEIKFGGNAKLLLDYLKNALHPALKRAGINQFMLFNELGNSDPKKIYALISYPNANIYLQAQNLESDATFVKAAMDYTAIPVEKPIFNRFSSWLLLAFDGMPKMMEPVEGASLYELRTYEGYSDDAVRRKIKMFNVEEIPLFLKVGLHPVFFGEMIAGPHRPCLTYMLNFKDMAEHDENWKKFITHPEWDKMKVKEEYANSVSNIRKVFLKPM